MYAYRQHGKEGYKKTSPLRRATVYLSNAINKVDASSFWK